MQHTTTKPSRAWRSRWAAVGAAVAVTLGAGGMVAVNAAPSAPSSVVTVDPTRIMDTRTNLGLPGPFFSQLNQQLQVTGSVPTQPPGGGEPEDAVVVPVGATAVILNVTVVGPVEKGFLSIRPGDATGVPETSNINWEGGGPNIANSVTVQLSAAGEVDIYQEGRSGGISGTSVSEVLIDVAGYTIPATTGPPGPQGDKGDPGERGDAGARGVSAWEVIPSGVTVSGFDVSTPDPTADDESFLKTVNFPAVLPEAPTSINFASDGSSITTDDDVSCTGSLGAPTAPPGQVCVYLGLEAGIDNLEAIAVGFGPAASFAALRAFGLQWQSNDTGDGAVVEFSWAYTAP